MAKLTKQERAVHGKACELLQKPVLSHEDKLFVLQHWHEGATHMNGSAGAHFTPWGLARDFGVDVGGGDRRVLDVCAGIGGLGFWLNDDFQELVCIEVNPAYVEVGKKILPHATWICADVFDIDLSSLGHFDLVISNPPFGRSAQRSARAPRYAGASFEYHLIDLVCDVANRGAFIIPQSSAGFQLSNAMGYTLTPNAELSRFEKETSITLEAGMGIDTGMYLNDWHDVKPLCEVVHCDFSELHDSHAGAGRLAQQAADTAARALAHASAAAQTQCSLF